MDFLSGAFFGAFMPSLDFKKSPSEMALVPKKGTEGQKSILQKSIRHLISKPLELEIWNFLYI